MPYKIYDIQLMDLATMKAIISAGGKVYVAADGDAAKATLYNPDSNFAALANPITPTRGKIRFATADTVTSVDLYIQAPGGQFICAHNVSPGNPNEIYVDTQDRRQIYVIPFAIGDTAANTLTDTGFDLVNNSVIHPEGMGVLVSTLDSGIVIDVGLGAGSETGHDADGLMDGILMTTAGFKPAAVGWVIGSNNVNVDLTGGGAEWTYGAYMHPAATKVAAAEGADAAATDGNGIYFRTMHVADGTLKSINYTIASSGDTAEGFIILPVTLLGEVMSMT